MIHGALALALLSAPRWFAVSTTGPLAGGDAIAVGGGLMVLEDGHLVPAFSADWAHGLTEDLDLTVSAHAGFDANASAGLFGRFDPGLQLRVLGRGGLELVLRGAPDLVFVTGDVSGFALFGLAPGVGVGAGTERLRVSLFADVPLHFAAVGTFGSGFDAALSFRPALTIELALSPVNVFLRGETHVFASTGRVLYGGGTVGATF